MDRGNFLLMTIFIAMALFTWWLMESDQDLPPQPANKSRLPEYYVENMTSIKMSDKGKPANSLSSLRMIHYTDGDITELVRPRIVVFDEERPPWEFRSSSGSVSGDGNTILLNGKVNIDRASGNGLKPFHMVTRDLRVDTEKDYAETDQPVHTYSLGNKMESVGMKAWLEAPMRIKLLSQARGRYEP